MSKYSDQDIINAKNLRIKEKYSFAQLQKITGIPATTIRNWCRGEIDMTRWNTLLITNDKKRQAIKLSEQSVFKTFPKLDTNNAKLYAALLYWCEGSKYPSTNKVCFTNSDPELILLFLTLLRKAFVIDEAKLRIHLQVHSVHDFSKLQSFWSEYLNVPAFQFIKPTITKMRGGKHRKLYNGTCTVRYTDFKVLLKLMGLYEEIAKRIIQAR